MNTNITINMNSISTSNNYNIIIINNRNSNSNSNSTNRRLGSARSVFGAHGVPEVAFTKGWNPWVRRYLPDASFMGSNIRGLAVGRFGPPSGSCR